MKRIGVVVPIVPVSLVSKFFLENLDKKLSISDIENGCRSILLKIIKLTAYLPVMDQKLIY